MEVLAIVGHALRLLSVGLMISKLCRRKGSCKGLSWKTQALFLIVFICDAILSMPRRMSDFIEDPFTPLCSATLLIGQLIVLTLFVRRANSNYAMKDDSRFTGHVATGHVLLNFRVPLDSIAMLPQLFMLSKIRGVQRGFFTSYFLLLVGYKLCLIVGMVLDYIYRGIEFSPQIVVLSLLQLFTYILFFIIPRRQGDSGEKFPVYEDLREDFIPYEMEDGKLDSKEDKESSTCVNDEGRVHNVFGCSGMSDDAMHHKPTITFNSDGFTVTDCQSEFTFTAHPEQHLSVDFSTSNQGTFD
ncbi:hypothetical protein AAG570_005737 [Ranatra chinensis]|uniref:Uncharacterized protein n=1 Tax=Ranatra chinensis TaxID=642074 RepID=A0ABD0XYA3_9HEMI